MRPPESLPPVGPLLRVRDLRVEFDAPARALGRGAARFTVIDGVSFDIAAGETLGLVGESGSGKTTAARAILRLVPPSGGTVAFDGVELTTLSPGAMRAMRRHMQMVFQDPYSSLDPRMKVGATMREPLTVHGIASGAEAEGIVDRLLEAVGLPPAAKQRYPHQFSGGQRQRIALARALVAGPRLVVCDEPTASLDVSVQAQVVNLLSDLQERFGLTYLLIAHDLSIVRHLSHRIAVMYLGRIVEMLPSETLARRAVHPYTRSLLAALRRPDPRIERHRRAEVAQGEIPSVLRPPPGCHFHTRCRHALDRCRIEVPRMAEAGPDHQVACHAWPALAAAQA